MTHSPAAKIRNDFRLFLECEHPVYNYKEVLVQIECVHGRVPAREYEVGGAADIYYIAGGASDDWFFAKY